MASVGANREFSTFARAWENRLQTHRNYQTVRRSRPALVRVPAFTVLLIAIMLPSLRISATTPLTSVDLYTYVSGAVPVARADTHYCAGQQPARAGSLGGHLQLGYRYALCRRRRRHVHR